MDRVPIAFTENVVALFPHPPTWGDYLDWAPYKRPLPLENLQQLSAPIWSAPADLESRKNKGLLVMNVYRGASRNERLYSLWLWDDSIDEPVRLTLEELQKRNYFPGGRLNLKNWKLGRSERENRSQLVHVSLDDLFRKVIIPCGVTQLQYDLHDIRSENSEFVIYILQQIRSHQVALSAINCHVTHLKDDLYQKCFLEFLEFQVEMNCLKSVGFSHQSDHGEDIYFVPQSLLELLHLQRQCESKPSLLSAALSEHVFEAFMDYWDRNPRHMFFWCDLTGVNLRKFGFKRSNPVRTVLSALFHFIKWRHYYVREVFVKKHKTEKFQIKVEYNRRSVISKSTR